ncbi:MAG TPA: MG2 domain-containing protein, partial [Candidatus Aminicenantes bacterium]|nr:MG2 domain-containing protein [Candidatus Aminicenantes bacterium]
ASLALYYWAKEVHDGGDFAKAHQLALRGEKLHPGSAGAANCGALLSRITAKEFDVRAESVLRPGQPAKLAVRYRNLRELHFRLFAENFEDGLADPEGGGMAWTSETRIGKLLARQPDAAWTSPLKPTEDFKETTALINIRPLEPGFYRLLVSSRADFSEKANKLQYASLWVSGLGLVSTGGGGAPGGYVVRNDSGEPVASAEVILYEWSYRDSAYIKKASALTDKIGAFDFKSGTSPEYGYHRLLVVRRKGKIQLSETNPPSYYPREDPRRTQTVFFTDRSIYRPGQTIFFKALCLDIDRPNGDYALFSGKPVRVYFRDANRQEIASLDAVSNDFGSFSGSFTAPADRLTGEMTISSESPRGGCSILVEEYKRPKFLVKLDVPDKEFRLNDEISINGEAVAYTGAPIDGAAVRYHVVREARYPWRRFDRPRGTRSQGSRQIAHGALVTDGEGKFCIAFKAIPDMSPPASSGAVFTYSVSADVTDSAGETRSAAGQVRAGYAALEADLQADEWQSVDKPVALTITTRTLNGKRAAAKGVIEIYSLKGPMAPVPQDLIGEEEIRGRKAAGDGDADGRAYSETPDWWKWPEDKLVGKRDFSTSPKEDAACVLRFSLKAGAYRARLKTTDKFGAEIEAMRNILVLDPEDSRFALKIPFLGASRTTRAEVGETFEALWGTGYGRGPVLVEILQNNRRLKRYWTPEDITQGAVKVAVEENLRGGFTVILSMVKENRLYRLDRHVSVPWTSKLLSLQWQSFRSKLQPGQKEKWAIQVRGPQAAVKAAEMVAILYDASLDQFRGHSFPAVSGVFRSDWTNLPAVYSNKALELQTFRDYLNPSPGFVAPGYPRFPGYITEDRYGYGFPARAGKGVLREDIRADMAEAPSPLSAAQAGEKSVPGGGVLGGIVEGAKSGAPEDKAPQVDLSKVQARKNLS